MRQWTLSLSQPMLRQKELACLPEEIWAYMELKEDPIFSHIDSRRYCYYVREGIRAGKESGTKWSLESIRKELQNKHVEVCFLEEKPPFAVHSQIIAEKGAYRIDVFLPVLREILPLIKEYEAGISMEDLKNIHLAHEFYHYLEYEAGESVSDRCDKVSYRTLRVFPRMAAVTRLREIGAHSFAKTVCGFSWSPQFLDYLLWEKQDENFAVQFAENCMDAYENFRGVWL